MKYILLILLFLNTLSLAEPLEKVSLQLHWKYQFTFAGFIAAKEKGFYKDIGLDVELKEYEFGMDRESQIINSKSEYGIYNSSSLVDYLKGKPVKLVASFFKRAALVLVNSPDITSPKYLVGKKIMATTKEDFILNYKPYFDLYGVDIDDVVLVPHTYTIDAFANGEVAAMSAFISNEVPKLNERGVKFNILDPSDDNLFVLQLELITSLDEVQNHPQRVRAFKEASIRGWQYALTHKDEIVDIIYKKYSQKNSKESLNAEAIGIEKLILPFTYDIGSIDKNFLNKQIKYFKKYYKIGDNIGLGDFIFENSSKDIEPLFNKDEIEYLAQNRIITLCTHPNIYPIDGYVDEKHSGIMGHIYTEIAKVTGFEFKIIPTKNYEDLDSKILSKECKIVSVLPQKNRSFKTLNMTEPFFHTNFTLISTVDKSFAQNFSDFSDKKLIVQFQEYKNKILQLHPTLNIEVQPDIDKMMKKVLNDKAFGVVTANEVADTLINEYGYGKLKINGFIGKHDAINGSMGVQKDDLILFSIMQKVLENLSAHKVDNIIKNWRLTRYQKVKDYTLVYFILAIAIGVMSIMLYYHRKLKDSNTKLVKTVEELTQKDRMLTFQSKQAVMGEMMSMIAHQWRQPLSTITLQISNLQIDKMMGKDVDNKNLDKVLVDISDKIIYLSETVDDFQTYFHPNKEKTNIGIIEFVEKVLTLNKARVETSGVSININIDKDIALNIYINELIQVFLNIINNSLDAFETQDINDKNIDISVIQENEYIEILIKDNAGGIKEEYLEKLFEPYFSTKGKNGTGLGLYMSSMIIQKQFGGSLHVEYSNAETTFKIKILKTV